MYQPFEAFKVTGRLISVIGSGGKTTLLRYLSERLPGTVILTTSTHIYPFPDLPLIDTAGMDGKQTIHQLRDTLRTSRVACLGEKQPSGKLASPEPTLSFEALLTMADYVIVEADGAAGRPLKAHRPWEPVVPACSDMTVCVVGASGLGKPAAEVCHCPERFAELAGISMAEPVNETNVAAALNREALADCYMVNQTDTLSDPARARRLCELIRANAFPCALAPRR